MPEETLTVEPGTGIPSPKRGRPPMLRTPESPKPQTDEEINWVTLEEAERCEKMMFKPFIRRVEKVKGESKKYFYQVMAIHPYVPLRLEATQARKFLLNVEVAKFYRDKFIDKKIYDGKSVVGKEVKVEEQVQRYSIDKEFGDAIDLDPDASFSMDSRQFEAEFKRDDT